VQTLLGAQADPNIQNKEGRTACFMAAQQGHAHVLKVLKHVADVQIAEFTEGATPLHAAALGGHSECARELITAGAIGSVLNLKGKTALQIAEENENHDVATLLRELMQHVTVADGAPDAQSGQ
jgi:ankyrin repeat protein